MHATLPQHLSDAAAEGGFPTGEREKDREEKPLGWEGLWSLGGAGTRALAMGREEQSQRLTRSRRDQWGNTRMGGGVPRVHSICGPPSDC